MRRLLLKGPVGGIRVDLTGADENYAYRRYLDTQQTAWDWQTDTVHVGLRRPGKYLTDAWGRCYFRRIATWAVETAMDIRRVRPCHV